MKTKFYFLGVLFTFSTIAVFAQWKYNNPYPAEAFLQGINFSGNSLGIAVGDGKILRTENGGEDWKEIFLDKNLYKQSKVFLMSVFFADYQNVWIVGDSGLILHSSNSGLEWVVQNSDIEDMLFSVFFIDENTGWATGINKAIIKSTDGGNTWTTKFSGNNGYLKDITFIDENIGWACGSEGIIFHTTDGGETWAQQQSGLSSTINSINFVDENTGFATGYESILIKTENGGNTWTNIHSFTEAVTDAYFVDNNTGYLACINGEILTTTDGGQTWTTVALNDNALIYTINGEGNSVFVAGSVNYGDGCNGAYISRSNDGGALWQEQNYSRLKPYGTGYSIFSTNFLDDSTGWIFALESETLNVGVFQTINGGKNWNIKTSDPTLFYFYDTDFANSTDGWGCNGWIYHTDDAGATWNVQYDPPPIPDELYAIHMINESTGWCVGKTGKVVKTTDGSTWETHSIGKSNDLYDVYFLTSQSGWIVGESGLILKTTDAGETWAQQQSNTTETLKSIDLFNEYSGWAAGENGVILHTTDGGETWTQQNSGFTEEVNKIVAISDWTSWLITTSPSKIYSTSDGGFIWTEYYRNFGSTLSDITFTNPDNGWIVGNGGLILHTDNCGGIVGVDNFSHTDKNSVITNFPNPFTAKTTISCNVKFPGIIKVEILNASGQQITTLRNTFQLAGEFSVEWDASGRPAGVYFCKISRITGSKIIKLVKTKE